MNLVGRVYRLEIEPPFSTYGEEALVIESLRIAFEIHKGDKANENKAEITITNMLNEGIPFLQEGSLIKLYLGYLGAGGEKLAFIGDVVTVYSYQDGPNRHTRIECVEGIALLSNSFSLSYGPGTKALTVLRDLDSKLNAANGDTVLGNKLSGIIGDSELSIDSTFSSVWSSFLASDIVLEQGLSFVGDIRKVLDYLCDSLGLVWSVQNYNLYIAPKDAAVTKEVVYLSSGSGLIGSPEKLERRKKKKNDPEGTNKGWRVKVQLFPELIPGDPVLIKSVNLEGTYRIKNLTHSGDNYGEDWSTTLEVFENDSAASTAPTQPTEIEKRSQ